MQDILGNLEALHRESEALVCVYDPDDRVSYANPAFRSAFYLGHDEHPLWSDLMRRNHALGRGSRIDAPDFEAWLLATLSRRAKLAHRSFETDLVDGRWLWIIETTLSSGWGLFLATDITGLRLGDRAVRKARDLALREAQTDELTGISNRRHILSILEALIIGQTIAGTNGGCVCILDIDHFKRLNDTYGHQVGDEALIAVARCARASLQVKDAFGRIGGEEFMLILPNRAHLAGKIIAEEILDAIRACRPCSLHSELSLTVSMGMTEIEMGDEVRTVFSRADSLLYEAKTAGRDRLVCG